MERDFSRWLDLFNPNLFTDKKVGIIGAWGIGSNSTYVLSKMWIKCKVCDFDEVDVVNTSSQFYWSKDLGKTKVEQAYEIGKTIGERALKLGIKKVVFDRSGYIYTGRVQKLAEGARSAGLEF